jgi:squalene-hopene/tetraprenyl-beta-curcumene cyclase
MAGKTNLITIPSILLTTLVLARAPVSASVDLQELQLAIAMSREALILQQQDEGYWFSPVETNTLYNCLQILLYHYLEKEEEERDTVDGLCSYLVNVQSEDGSWPLYSGGPPDLGLTTLNYFTLKLSGYSPEDPTLAVARDYILTHGGAESVNELYKLLLAVFDQYQLALPRRVPLLPLLWIAPKLSWMRMLMIPFVVVLNEDAFFRPPEETYITELFLNPTGGRAIPQDGQIFSVIDEVTDLAKKEYGEYSTLSYPPLCFFVYQIYADWLLARQNTSDDLFYDFMPTTFLALLSLKAIEDHLDNQEAIDRGLDGLRFLRQDLPEGMYQAPSDSTIWDTLATVAALSKAELSLDNPIMQKGVDFLWSRQHEKHGDWRYQIHTPVSPGGWGFTLHSESYPDLDCTASTLLTLRDVYGDSWEDRGIDFNRGIDWLLVMQNWDGGWGTWDRQAGLFGIFVTMVMKELVSPFVLNESIVDHTTRVLMTLSRFGHTEASSPSVRRAVRWMKAQRLEDGSWAGTWFVNYVYQTAFALGSLSQVKADMSDAFIQKSLDYIVAKQKIDGGWGESTSSFYFGLYVPLGYSSPSQTAMILWGLIHFLEGRNYEYVDYLRVPIENAINFLLASQGADGLWRDPTYAAVVFPGIQFARYPIFHEAITLWVLGKYYQDIDYFAESSENDPSPDTNDPMRCYIATAAFGSKMTGKIGVLREFRDSHLMTYKRGRNFVNAYYRYSPPIADYIARHEWLRNLVRTLTLPVIGFASLFV